MVTRYHGCGDDSDDKNSDDDSKDGENDDGKKQLKTCSTKKGLEFWNGAASAGLAMDFKC